MGKKLAVLFPGTGYTCREPLMQKIAETFSRQGFEVVKLDFSAVPFHEIATLDEAAERAQPLVLEQLKNCEPAAYQSIVFVSKSLGTVCAGRLEEQWGLPVRQIYLTPLPETLAYVKAGSRVAGMVIGTQDKFLAAAALQNFCRERGIPCLVARDMGHRLDHADRRLVLELEESILALCGAAL